MLREGRSLGEPLCGGGAPCASEVGVYLLFESYVVNHWQVL